MAVFYCYFLIVLVQVHCSSASLIGHYKLYDSTDPKFYDFSGNTNHAEFVKDSTCTSSNNLQVTDRGAYLTRCQAIKFPPTSLPSIVVSTWVNLIKDLGYIFVLYLENSTKYQLKYDYDTLTSTKLKLYEDDTKISDKTIGFELDIRNTSGTYNFNVIGLDSVDFTGEKTFYINSFHTYGGVIYVHEVWWYDTTEDSSQFDSVYTDTVTRQTGCTSSPSVPCMGTSIVYEKNSQEVSCSISGCSDASAKSCYSDKTKCVQCNKVCTLGCFDFLSPKCIEDNLCTTNALYYNSACVCPVKYIQTQTNPVKCESSSGCPGTCVCDSNNDCVLCHGTATLNPGGSACQCLTGYTKSINNGILTCTKNTSCQSGCTCDSNYVCIGCSDDTKELEDEVCVCKDAYIANTENPEECIPKVEHCKTYTDKVCSVCEDNYYLDNKSCKPCSENCKVCSKNASNELICTQCDSTYYIQPTTTSCALTCPNNYYEGSERTLKCEGCLSSCKKCTSNETCTECNTNLYLKSEGSVLTCVPTCGSRYYQSESDIWQCQPCSAYCLSCEDSGCTDCESNFYLKSDKTCQPCLENCKKCNSNDDCTQCQSNYYLKSDGASPECVVKCPSDYYILTQGETVYCLPCSENCQACESSTDCSKCIDNYYKYTDGLITNCVDKCPSSYYQDVTLYCLPCAAKCKTCASSTHCIECIENYYRYTDELSTHCIDKCPSGYYQDVTMQCLACVANCKMCGSSTDCSECKENYYKYTDELSTHCLDKCPSGYYQDVTMQCLSCPETCKICVSSNNCSECKENYYKYTKDQYTHCIGKCPSGYYQNETTKSCIDCGVDNCNICQFYESSLKCISCKDSYELTSGQCNACQIGTYYFNYKCYDCPSLCINCISSSICTSCVSSATFTEESQCICSAGMIKQAKSCIPDNNLAVLSATASIISENTISLIFNKDLNIILDSSMINLNIDGIVYTSKDFTITSDSLNSYIISMKDFSLESSKKIQVIFSDSSQIHSVDGTSLTDESISITNLPNEDSSGSSNTSSQEAFLEQDPQAEAIHEKGTTSTRVISSGAAIMSVNVSTSLWNFINTLQLISFIPMLNIDLPVILFSVLSALRGYSPIPNFFSYFIETEGPEPYEKAVLLGFESAQFMINCGEMLSALLIFLGIYPIIFTISKLLPVKYSKSYISARLVIILDDYHWNFFSRYYIESYMEIAVATLLQITCAEEAINYGTANMYINFLFSILGLVMIFILPGFIAYFIYENSKKFQNESFMKKWGSYFEEFNNSKCKMCSMYYVFFILRRLLVSMCFIFLRRSPEVQVSFASVLCWTVRYNQFFIYIVWYQPFKHSSMNTLNIIVEFNIAACYTLVGFYLLDLSKRNSDALQWIIISLVLISLLANLISIVHAVVTGIIHLIRKYRKRREAKVKVGPEEEACDSYNAKNEQSSVNDDDGQFKSATRCLDATDINGYDRQIEIDTYTVEPYEFATVRPKLESYYSKTQDGTLKDVIQTSDLSFTHY